MSFDIFLQRFERGEIARGDGLAVAALLAPLVDARDERWMHITTPDGGADVYGVEDPASGLMVNHTSGREVWDVVFALAQAGGFVVMPVGCGTCILSESERDDLPDEGPESVIRVASGGELRHAVQAE